MPWLMDAISGFDQNKYYDTYTMFKDVVGSDDPRYTTQGEDGQTVQHPAGAAFIGPGGREHRPRQRHGQPR